MKKDTSPLPGNNGKLYLITSEKKKLVKEVKKDVDQRFIINATLNDLAKGIEIDNTKTLHQLLKPEFNDAFYAKGYVEVADYKIRFASHGFRICDRRNFMKAVNLSDYNNDYATPESVLLFLRKTQNRAFSKSDEDIKTEQERGNLMKLARLGKLTIEEAKKSAIPVKTIIIKQPKKIRMLQTIKSIFDRYTTKKLKYKESLAQIKKALPEAIEKDVVKVFNDLHKDLLPGRVALKKIDKIIIEHTTYLEKRKLEIKEAREAKKVPKEIFQAPILWEPINPRVMSTDVLQTINVINDRFHRKRITAETKVFNDAYGVAGYDEAPFTESKVLHKVDQVGYFTVLYDADIMWMKFDTKGPAGKKYEVVCTVEEYLANVVLHHYPKAMALLMKVAKGEMDAPDLANVSVPSFYQYKALQEKYDSSWLRHPYDRNEFCRFCRAILEKEGTEHAFLLEYNTGFKVGDQVKVFSPMTMISENGVVIDTDSGTSIRFAFGAVEKLKKGERLELYSWKK